MVALKIQSDGGLGFKYFCLLHQEGPLTFAFHLVKGSIESVSNIFD